jgi:hypothetical protein
MGANDSRLASTYGQGSEGEAGDDSGAGTSSPGQPSHRRSHSEQSPAGHGNGNSPAGAHGKSRRGDAFDPPRRQGLTLVRFSAQLEPFLTLNTSPERLNTPSTTALNTPYTSPKHPWAHQ